jgi:hypothetical protein
MEYTSTLVVTEADLLQGSDDFAYRLYLKDRLAHTFLPHIAAQMNVIIHEGQYEATMKATLYIMTEWEMQQHDKELIQQTKQKILDATKKVLASCV